MATSLLDDPLDSPWVWAGLAVALGYAAGRFRDAGMLKTLVKTLVIAGARSLAQDVFARSRDGASAKWSSPRDLAVH